jgi:NSS family neurotransmitter:Na+ symporter
VAWLTENRRLSRARASLLVGGLAWFLGIGSALSFNLWSGDAYKVFGKTLFDLKDYLTTNIMLPLGGLAIALFAGWAVGRRLSEEELAMRSPRLYGLWRFTIRYIAPGGIVLVFLNAIGVV